MSKESENKDLSIIPTGGNQISRTNTNTNDFLNQIKSVLLEKFPNQAIGILKKIDQTEEAQEKKEEQTQLELEKSIAKHFQANYIRHTGYLPGTFHIRTPQGEYIVDTEKNVLVGPAKRISVCSNHGNYYNTLTSSYIDHEDRTHLYCIDENKKVFTLAKEKHYNILKPILNYSGVCVLRVSGESKYTHNNAVTSVHTPEYEYIIDENGKRISKPYADINKHLIVSKGSYEEGFMASRLCKIGNEYKTLDAWHEGAFEVEVFDNNCVLFVGTEGDTKYYYFYNADNQLVKKLQIVGYQHSPFVGRDEQGCKIIYNGNLYELDSMEGFYPVLELDSLDCDRSPSYSSVFMKNKDDKLVLWKEGEFVGLDTISSNTVKKLFHNQISLYNPHGAYGILVDNHGKVLDTGSYSVPWTRDYGNNEKSKILLENYYITKSPLGADKYTRASHIITHTGIVSEAFDKICDDDDNDQKIILEHGVIRIEHGEKQHLFDIKTGKLVIENATEIKYFMGGHIYVSYANGPRGPGYDQDTYLLGKNLKQLIGPVFNIKEYENMIRLEDKDGNYQFLFPDLTVVGQ